MKKSIRICIAMLLACSVCMAQGQQKENAGKGKPEQAEKGSKENKGQKEAKDDKTQPDNKGQQMKELNEIYNQRKRAIMNDENLSKTEKQEKLKALNKQHNEDISRINGGKKEGDDREEKAEKSKEKGEKGEKGDKGEKGEKDGKEKKKQKN